MTPCVATHKLNHRGRGRSTVVVESRSFASAAAAHHRRLVSGNPTTSGSSGRVPRTSLVLVRALNSCGRGGNAIAVFPVAAPPLRRVAPPFQSTSGEAPATCGCTIVLGSHFGPFPASPWRSSPATRWSSSRSERLCCRTRCSSVRATWPSADRPSRDRRPATAGRFARWTQTRRPGSTRTVRFKIDGPG